MLRLRQIAMVGDNLPSLEAETSRLLETGICYRDPGVAKYGLNNALWALGGTFLEALAPFEPNTTAGRYMARRGGPTGYMIILDADDLGPARMRLTMLQVRVVEDLTVGDAALNATALHLHPHDTGGCLLSLDRHGPDQGMMGSYAWAGADWQRHCRHDMAITGAVLACQDPHATAARWTALLARPSAPIAGGLRISLDHGAIDFIPISDDRGEGLAAIRIRGLAAPARICGLDFLPGDQP